MIRYVHCVKRRPDLSPDEFRRFWNSREFSNLLKALGDLLGASRIERSLTLVIDMNIELMVERGADEPFDAMLEVWLENARVLEQRRNSREFSLIMEQLENFQKQFVDFANSRRFFTDWEALSSA